MLVTRVLKGKNCEQSSVYSSGGTPFPSSSCLQRARSHLPCSDASLPTVFEVVTKLPHCGVGATVQRSKWHDDSFWQLTAVQPSVVRRSHASRPPMPS